MVECVCPGDNRIAFYKGFAYAVGLCFAFSEDAVQPFILLFAILPFVVEDAVNLLDGIVAALPLKAEGAFGRYSLVRDDARPAQVKH